MSRLLVCPPDYFGIEYEINPWMRRSNAVDSGQAIRQWHHLMQVLEQDVGAVQDLHMLVRPMERGIFVGTSLSRIIEICPIHPQLLTMIREGRLFVPSSLVC